MNLKVTVIVPAYNEENRIKKNLQTLCSSHLIDEVICVNDGSFDKTGKIARSIKGVTLINLEKNHGKAYAIGKGIKEAIGDIVVFIDGDVSNLHDKSIAALIKPLREGKYNAAIGLRSRHLEELFFLPLTGERAYFRNDLLGHIAEFEHKGFGLELYLNYVYRNRKVKYVFLSDLKHVYKYQKRSLANAVRQEVNAWKEILHEIMGHNNPLEFLYYSYVLPYARYKDE